MFKKLCAVVAVACTSGTCLGQGVTNSVIVGWGRSVEVQTTTPAAIGLVVQIAAGDYHSVALRHNGSVLCWGSNADGQCNTPANLGPVKRIAAGYNTTIALLRTGSVACWGVNVNGECNVPAGLSDAIQVAGGGYHNLALRANGTIVSWGWNGVGQRTTPAGIGPVKGIGAGHAQTIAIREDGSVWCWGRNDSGECNVPPGLSNIGSVSGGGFHSLARATDGRTWYWGSNGWGQDIIPSQVQYARQVGGGHYHCLALALDRTVQAWGGDWEGQAQEPAGLAGVVQIAAGGYHNLALLAADEDGDGIDNTVDNCPLNANPLQTDSDNDGIGDVCENITTRYVPTEYATIQSAINASAPFDTVQVAAGTYAGPIDFMGKNIVVRGASAATTILSGTSGQSSSVVRMMNAEPATARLENFTITGGLTGSPVPGNKSARAGGGVFMYQSAATISSCIIQNNGASFGAGIYLLYCSGVVENCTIRNNSGDAYGGGGLLFDCSTIVRNCEITGNSTVTAGGGLHIVQIPNSNFAPQIVNCSIMVNSTTDRGGGIAWQGGLATLQIIDSNIAANAAPLAGGGIYIYPTGGVNRTNLVSTDVCSNSYPNISGDYTLDSASHVCKCAGDINSDRQIDGIDLAILLSTWGTDGGTYPNADTNSDGVVNGVDMTIILSGWGSCASQYGPAWGTVLEWTPNPAVVTNVTMRNAITATGLPWRVRDNGTNIEMLLVPGGTFMMGCSPGDGECGGDENPAHQVTLTDAFYLGKTEVTQAQWTAEMGSNPSAHQGNTQFPVEMVSWTMAQSFCTTADLRLPTEAEWEYACRGRTITSRYGVLEDIAWYGGNSIGTQTVATKLPNALGLYDMLGNVHEWCQDSYRFYTTDSVTNPIGSGSGRLHRGGSIIDGANLLRASWRSDAYDESFWWHHVGFRVARNP